MVGDEIDLGLASRTAHALAELDVFVDQTLGGASLDEERRQAGQIGEERRDARVVER